MATQTGPLQLKRGTTAETGSVTPEPGEPVWDMELHELKIGDGSTPGGVSASQLGFLKTLGVDRQVNSKLSFWRDARDYGAVGDGISRPLSSIFGTLAEAQERYPHAVSLTDELDWAALQAAFNGETSVVVGVGKFLCNRPLTAKNKNIVIKGLGSQASEIRYTSQVAYGIRIEQTSAYETNIQDIFISTSLLNNGYGLSVSYAGFVGTYERNKRFVTISGNRVSGTDYFSYGWKRCFDFDEVTLPLIENNFAVGFRDLSGAGELRWWPWTEYGYYFSSTTNLSPTDILYNSNDCRYAKTAYQTLGVLEGVRYNNCLAVACKNGIVDDRREITGPLTIDPWLRVDGCHLNVSSVGIQTFYAYLGWVTDNLIYQFTFVDDTFFGVTTETGNNWKILCNHITGNSSSAFTTTGIKVQQNNRSLVAFNEIEAVSVPIECSGTNGITGTRFVLNRGTDKAGAEATTVAYTNGAVATSNPSTVMSGIISEGANAAAVAITSGSFATVNSFSLDSYPLGAVFRITSNCQILKGGTAGTTKLYVEKTSGSAAVSYMSSASGMGVQNDSHTASVNWQANLCGIIKKTSSGTLTLKVAVSSNGSNASVAVGDGQYILERIA